jgi:hypothetical protein
VRRNAALGAVVLAALAAAGAAPGQSDVPTRDCRSHIESGRGPIGFAADGIVAGPVAFSGLQRVATSLGRRGQDGRYFVKSAATVRAGRPVTLSISARFSGRIGLAYARTPEPVAAVRFEPCPPATRAFSYDGRVGPVTAFNGGFVLTRAGCYRFEVRVEGGRTYSVRVPFGYPCR